MPRSPLFLPLSASLLLPVLPPLAAADPPKVERATVREQGGAWTVTVTLSHSDTGWDHYADGWRVLDADGNELGHRVLHHPHVEEQPFTRSLGGLVLPASARRTLFIEPRCNADGWSGTRYPVEILK